MRPDLAAQEINQQITQSLRRISRSRAALLKSDQYLEAAVQLRAVLDAIRLDERAAAPRLEELERRP